VSKLKAAYDTIIVTNIATGEIEEFKGVMMVAPNGMVFIQCDGRTIWASAQTDFIARVK
jgi:hypothetical protein